MTSSSQFKVVKVAGGPVTVAYKQVAGEWHCTALQFDILGIGKTREAAFAQLKELMNSYLTHVLQLKGKIAFFNPADREEWNTPIKENYNILVILTKPRRDSQETSCMDMEEIRPVRRRVREFDLLPAGA
jgi:hypothetical protein